MSKFVLRAGVREEDVAEIVRRTQPSVKTIVDGIEPKSDGGGVLAEMRNKKTTLMNEMGDVDATGVLSALMDKDNKNPEAVKIRRLFEHLRDEKAKWWSMRVLDQGIVNQIVLEELEIGILEAIKAGADIGRYVREAKSEGKVGERVEVRKAGQNDLGAIKTLLTEGAMEMYGLNTLPQDKVMAVGLEHQLYYLGFVGGELAGLCALDPCHDVAWLMPNGDFAVAHNAAYIKDEFTLPQYRKSGVSGALTVRVIADAKKRGIRELYAAAESKQEVEEYLRMDFTVCGTCLTCPKGPRCGGKLVKKDLGK